VTDILTDIVTEDGAESGRGSGATTVVRVGAIAVEPARGDREANVALAERLVAEAAGRGAELVVLPEGFLEGYVVNEPEMTRERFLALAEPLDGPYVARFRALAREHGAWLLACFAEREGPAVYNTALLLAADGAIAGRYRKTHVQSGGDWRFYAPGEALPVFATPWGPTGVMICYDRQFPEVPRALARQGARLLLNPSWGMFNDLNEAMMRTRAHENGVYIVFAHVRGALVLDPRGAVAARSDPEATVLVHEVDLAVVDAVRRSPRGHLIDHLRPDLYAGAGSGERRERGTR
jgi:predicted amidohydrolase